MHLVNPDATLWGAIAIAIEAGCMLAACYAATRNLWVPIGLHFGWNFAAGGIFSTVVSGNGASQGLLDATTSGPALLTGGDFGPEASLYTVVAGVLADRACSCGWPTGAGTSSRAAAAPGPTRPLRSPGDRPPEVPDRWRRWLDVTVRDLPLALLLAVASLRAGAARPRDAARRRCRTRPFDALAVVVIALAVPPARRAPAVAGRLPRPGVARLRARPAPGLPHGRGHRAAPSRC